MPAAFLTPCRRCGKGAKDGLCDSCKATKPKGDGRPSAAARLYDRNWRAYTARYKQENPLCADPYNIHQGVTVEAIDVDHITPHRGDLKLFWERTNHQGLCKSCHSRKTATEDGGFGR